MINRCYFYCGISAMKDGITQQASGVFLLRSLFKREPAYIYNTVMNNLKIRLGTDDCTLTALNRI
jgi:hypothetical protein